MSTVMKHGKPVITKAHEVWTYTDGNGRKKTIRIKIDVEKDMGMTRYDNLRGRGLLAEIWHTTATISVERLDIVYIPGSEDDQKLIHHIAQSNVQVNLERLKPEKLPK